jgi:hypothetical protein
MKKYIQNSISGLKNFKPPSLNPLIKFFPTLPRAHPNSPINIVLI